MSKEKLEFIKSVDKYVITKNEKGENEFKAIHNSNTPDEEIKRLNNEFPVKKK